MPQGNLAKICTIELELANELAEFKASVRAIEEGVSVGEPQRALRLMCRVETMTAKLRACIDGDA